MACNMELDNKIVFLLALTQPLLFSGSATPSTGTMISKKKVLVKIQEIADYKLVDGKKGRFWVVKPEILEQVNRYKLSTLHISYLHRLKDQGKDFKRFAKHTMKFTNLFFIFAFLPYPNNL